MIAGKNQAAQIPTALGSMLQASTYGLVITVPYGRCQTPLAAIWAQNLREGGSGKKFKNAKKGVTAYCENIDFLLGKNPILGVLQMWNNGAILPLSDQVYSTTATSGSSGVFTVPDSHFYAVLGVTLEVAYSATFNDYGAPGPSTLTGTFEVPLWNQLFNGPDMTGSSDPRNFPYCYRWQPSYGATIYIDQLPFGALATGTLRIYYSQLTAATKFQSPAARLRLSFENILGSGSEYSGFTAQQILYPMYAGMGSPNIDLGSAGTIPALKAEVQAKWGYTPAGDCDFVDIIEDVLKSGLVQAGLDSGVNYSQTEHGIGAYNLPGTIQKKIGTNAGGADLPPMLYDLPNTAGNILVCSAFGQGGLSIASSNAEVWIPLVAGSSAYQMWYATAIGGVNTVTVSGAGDPSEVAIYEIGGIGPPHFSVDSSTAYPGTLGDIAAGTITRDCSASIGTPSDITLTWSDFTLIEALPADAVIVDILITYIGRYIPNVATASFTVGNNGGASGITSPGSSFSQQSKSFGTHISALEGAFFTPNIECSLPLQLNPPWSPPDEIDISNVGIAIYYTSAGGHAPTATPPMANPVAPGAGQYVTWAVPTNVTAAGLYHHPGPGSIFGGAQGDLTAVGTAYTWSPAPAITSLTPLVRFSNGHFSTDFTATSVSDAILDSTVTPDFPAFLLAVPFYSGDSPASARVAKWEALTPTNFYSKTLVDFQAHGRIISNPGEYSFQAPGTDSIAIGIIGVNWTDPPVFAKPSRSFLNLASTELTRAQCRAGGLVGSLSLNAQRAAADWIQDLCQAADCVPFFAGHELYLWPRSEVSAVGNGAIYNAPTAAGPEANLSVDNGDFVAQPGEPAIRTPRKARTDTDTILQMQHINRGSNYAQVTTSEPDAASILIYGIRKGSPITNNAVQDVSIARSILSIEIRRRNYVEGLTYTFTLNQRWALLNPMSLVTLTDSSQGLDQVPVRIISWEENDQYEIDCEAEPFVYGIHAPQALPATNPTSYSGNQDAQTTAGNVNAPVIFEPVPQLSGLPTQRQLWLVISSSATNYGGCQVYISTDGGSSYQPLNDPVAGSAITGLSTSTWPAATDPDTTNDLPLNLTESNGVLASYATSDEDAFLYPCLIAGGGANPIPYELMTYAVATMTSANHYTLKATGGNHLRRAVFAAPDSTGNGVSHSSGSRWAFLSPSGQGILKANMDPAWVGVTLYFKILSFNSFGAAIQSLADVSPYTYTPTGIPGGIGGQWLVNGA